MIYIDNNKKVFTLKPCSNSELVRGLSEANIIVPKVPMFYYERTDTWIPNADNPTYRRAMEIYEIDKQLISTKIAIGKVIEIDDEVIKAERKKVKYRLHNYTDLDIWVDYIQNTVSQRDLRNIVNLTLLTENTVYDIFDIMVRTIYRGNSEIVNARLKNAINSQIHLDNIVIMGLELVHSLDEYNACINANIDWISWNKLDIHNKAEVIALYRINKIVESHSQDEVQIEMEKKSKK